MPQEIQFWDRRLSLFIRQSLVSYINLIAHAKPVKLNNAKSPPPTAVGRWRWGLR